MKVIDKYASYDIRVEVIEFEVPLDYSNTTEKINVVIKVVNKIKNKTNKFILYLQGGPGFASPFPTSSSDPGYINPLLDRGYTVILLDQRGTGLSTVIDTDVLISKGNVNAQFEYLKNFRADSIVLDCECIRKELEIEKWYLLGQSFGGFVSISYASFFPDSLEAIFLTGGLPPIAINDVTEVYTQTFKRTKEREDAYYAKFPQDEERIEFILNQNEIIPAQFNRLGMTLGASGGSVNLHGLVLAMFTDFKLLGRLSTKVKRDYENYLGFEQNILYALFQEAIYINGPGIKSDWAAEKLITSGFTGEIVDSQMFDTYSKLRPLKGLAHHIHQYENWSIIYNIENLKTITWDRLPIIAQVYLDDQYVDYELGRRNYELFSHKQIVTNQLFHNGLRSDSVNVINALHKVLEQGEYI
ncbi:hypothetical protein CANINC_000243 [Pichia inconspicua]|uniref:AB hydrolase-1 domain-containing protein n=1 Tax=Pichia inconspicua TaxID=52247 RepID=A0A4T0X736_9ASCO|nr:hypothetical protein CANINC_000243 [[Candida] inconspicua]